MIGRLILFAMILSCSHVVGQDRVYITNVASDKAKKIYFDQYSNDTRNWVHFINNPHKAEIKVYLKETCFQADIEVVSHIDLKADWVMITQHAHEADARVYLSSYYNAEAKGIYITGNPYDADVTICLNKDEYLKGFAGDERQERLQKLIAAVMYERMFVPDTGGLTDEREKLKVAHKTAELAGEVTDDMRVKLGQAIVHDSLMTNIDYLKRLVKRSSDIKFYADSCKQTIKALLAGGLSNCYGMSSELSNLISTIETLLLDVRDGERRIDLAIRYNGDDTLEDLKLALEYYDAVLKGTIQAISRIEDIDKRLDDCN